MSLTTKEFIGQRSQFYKEIHNEFPNARNEEIELNMRYFKPQKGEKILEIGAGSGLYTKRLAELVGLSGEIVATDPSEEQLENIRDFHLQNVRIIKGAANTLIEESSLIEEKNSFDALWSLGAFHHCPDKSSAFHNFRQLLKPNGRIFICDVFSGSTLARYFDAEVARFSITGHEVAFLTEEFADSLCYLYGFSEPKFHALDYQWNFKSKKDLGLFMYKIHGMSKTTPEECLEKVEEFMEIEQKNDDLYVLHVPLTILETYKK